MAAKPEAARARPMAIGVTGCQVRHPPRAPAAFRSPPTPRRPSPRHPPLGILKTPEIPRHLASHGEVTYHAETGDVLLMRPLLLHASSQATEPRYRRVLHIVYHTGTPGPELWHRAV